MTKQPFVLPPVPPSSRFLVAKIKLRLSEAIELGRPRDARMYLDIIERLARMNWLDDTLPVKDKTNDQEFLRTAKVAADIDSQLAQALQTPTNQETKTEQAHAHSQKDAQKDFGCPWEQLKQPLPTFTQYKGNTGLGVKGSYASPQKRQSSPVPPLTRHKDKPHSRALQHSYDQAKSVSQNLEDYLKSAAALSP